MAFTDWRQAMNRLKGDPSPLSREELTSMWSFLPTLTEGELRPFWAHMVLMVTQALNETREAIVKFDHASAKLTARIYWLTWALIFIGVASVIAPILIWRLTK